jgi:flagellar motor protein MotB
VNSEQRKKKTSFDELRNRRNELTYPDPFGNWELSNRRAMAVFKFFANCQDCGTQFSTMRRKISLAGIGDTKADTSTPDNVSDRTVDIIIDCSRQ